MTAGLFAGAAAAWAAAAAAYFHARFRLAGLCGAAFWGLGAAAAAQTLPAWGAAVAIGLLGVVPAVFLLIHVVDAKKGIFLLPTVYSIPLAFLCGLMLLAATGLGLLL